MHNVGLCVRYTIFFLSFLTRASVTHKIYQRQFTYCTLSFLHTFFLGSVGIGICKSAMERNKLFSYVTWLMVAKGMILVLVSIFFVGATICNAQALAFLSNGTKQYYLLRECLLYFCFPSTNQAKIGSKAYTISKVAYYLWHERWERLRLMGIWGSLPMGVSFAFDKKCHLIKSVYRK